MDRHRRVRITSIFFIHEYYNDTTRDSPSQKDLQQTNRDEMVD